MAKGKFWSQHLNKVEKAAPISINQLQKGMIIRYRYRKLPRKGKPGGSREYLSLILNPLFKNFVHALSLEEFSVYELNDVAEKHGLTYLKVPPMFKALDFSKIVMKESSLRFYRGSVKKFLGSELGNSYRTFSNDRFGPISVVDYDFDQRIQDLYLK